MLEEFWTVRTGDALAVTALLIGAIAFGALMAGFGKISKPAAANGPVFAPSSARTRQKYPRPISSRSSCTLVRPPAPGATRERLNTRVAKPLSVATSKVYERGRTPVDEAFSMSSLIGCCDSLNLKPCAGSSSFGGVMSTPGIGPATDGLSGFELFLASHPANTTVNRPTRTVHRAAVVLAAFDFMALPLDTKGYEKIGRMCSSQTHTIPLSAPERIVCRENVRV